MVMKRYFTFPNIPGLKPHCQMQFSVISKTLVGVLPLCREYKLVYSFASANWTHELLYKYIYKSKWFKKKSISNGLSSTRIYLVHILWYRRRKEKQHQMINDAFFTMKFFFKSPDSHSCSLPLIFYMNIILIFITNICMFYKIDTKIYRPSFHSVSQAFH